jgi:type I restriction enzyme M protein
VAKELRDIDQQINENEKELVGMLKELTSSDDDIMAGLQSIIEDFEEEIR